MSPGEPDGQLGVEPPQPALAPDIQSEIRLRQGIEGSAKLGGLALPSIASGC